jgi:hypothetical protein
MSEKRWVHKTRRREIEMYWKEKCAMGCEDEK